MTNMEDKNKKKRIIIILIVAGLLLIGLGTVCLVNVLGIRDRASDSKIASSTEIVLASTEGTSTESGTSTTEKATTEKASTEGTSTESGTSNKPKDTTEVSSTPQNSTSAPSTTAAPSTTQAPTTEREKVWHEPTTEMVWVVDKEAWTETYPEYDDVYVVRCHGCQGIFYSGDSFWEHVNANPNDECLGGFTGEYIKQEVGTTEIYHEEEGHWESVVVQEGYWE